MRPDPTTESDLTEFGRAIRELCNPSTPEHRKDALETELSERWDRILRKAARGREPGED